MARGLAVFVECVCLGGLSGRGTGSAWTSGQEGENERAKFGGGGRKMNRATESRNDDHGRCLKELEQKNERKIGFIIPLFWVFLIFEEL